MTEIEMILEMAEMQEEWKDIKGYEGMYQVSNFGRIKSVSRERHTGGIIKDKMLKPRPNQKKSTHFSVALFKHGNRENRQIHRLVAEAFISNPFNKPYVNHIDGNPRNNFVSNLEWCTPKENTNHAWRTGLCKNSTRKGKNNPNSKPVNVFTIKGEYVGEFESISIACDKLGVSKGNAMSCYRGNRKHAGGYVFFPPTENVYNGYIKKNKENYERIERGY